MKIPAAKFDAFQSSAEEAFVNDLLRFARRELEVWVRHDPDDILRERIRSGIARARSHGFAWQSSIAKFVSLMLRFAPNFDEYPPIRQLLDRTDVEPEARADLLFTEIAAEHWEGAEVRDDALAWQDFATGRVL
jgi:hypothetical protein